MMLFLFLVMNIAHAANHSCEKDAERAVRAIMNLHISQKDMKSLEIRSTKILAKDKDEEYEVVFGYKKGELNWENYRTRIVLAKTSGHCMVRKYEALF